MPQAVGKAAFGIADFLRYNEVYFDSSERTYGTTNSPNYSVKPLTNVVGFKLLDAQIPFSYYVFPEGRNTFQLYEPATDATTTVTIPPGNYTPSSFVAVLQTALETAGDAEYTVVFSTATGKFTITSSVAEPFAVTFDFDGPGTWIGFTHAATFTASAGGVLVAPFVARLSGPDYIYVCSQSLGFLNYNTLRLGDAATSGAVVAKIPVTVNPGGVITWTDPDPTKLFECDVGVLERVDLYVAAGGDVTTPLDFNGAPFSLKFMFVTSDGIYVKRGAGDTLGNPAKRMMFSN
ncbi:hypothetical protein SpCBS45565_g08396 [Spizellomyces sp. 'palustris']|nr:hypothetical protein SpCBS45565_g08396 [Spizellomyces sp. 'palustris']